MLNTTPMYSLKDIAIIPAVTSRINHRYECNTTYNNGMLPVFASPMSSVVNLKNLDTWINNKITPIIPRNIKYDDRIDYMFKGYWVALSLKEFAEINTKSYIDNNVVPCDKKFTFNLLIDVANGHMKQIYDLCRDAKDLQEKYQNVYDLNIMIGNIANPETINYIIAMNRSRKVGKYIDYVRCGIGGGNCCFVDGTQILMVDGQTKSIEDVNIGDEVITSDLSPHKVTNLIRFETDKNIIKINNNITCTDDHKFYVINKENKDIVTEDNLHLYAKWVPACELNENYLLVKYNK